MSESDALLVIIVGCIAEAIAILNKRFYWATPYSMRGDKKAPRWAGRLLFGIVGTLFLLIGIRYFLVGY